MHGFIAWISAVWTKPLGTLTLLDLGGVLVTAFVTAGVVGLVIAMISERK